MEQPGPQPETAPEEPAAVLARLKPWRTDLDSFNQLVDVTAEYLEGHRDLSEVQRQIDLADQELGQLRLQFQDGVRFQEPSEELESHCSAAWWMFSILQRQFEALSVALEENRPYNAALALQESNAAVNQLFWSFKTLRQRLQQEEKYSESPYIHELIRVGKACLAGTLSMELFQERFEAFCVFHDQFIESLQEYLPQMHSSETHQPLVHALEEQNFVIDDIAAFFEDGDEDQLDDALNRLQSSTATLLQVQQALQALETVPTTHGCPRCGADNEVGIRFCRECQARLIDPQVPTQARSLDSQALPPHLQKVLTAAESFRANQIQKEAFLEVVDWYDGLAAKANQQLRELTPPPSSGLPADQLALYEEALGAMDQALTDLRNGIARLRTYAEKRNPLELEFGMDSCLAGHEHMQRFAALNQSVAAP